MSVSFWIRPDPASQTNPCYVYRHGSWGGDGRQFVFWIVNEGKEIEVEIDNWLTADTPNSPRFAVAGLMDGGWHHVAFGYDANTLKVWYDGELKSTKTGTHTLSISSGTEVVLGSNETGKRFVGAMDEVSVWDHQLTDEEVAAEYAFAHPRVEDPAALLPEPVCHWTFDDADNPGKAAKGGADLVRQEGVGDAPSLVANTGAFGGSALKSTVALKAAQADLPANFPKGDSPYTVSLRFSSNALQEDEVYICDLIGCEAVDETGAVVGTLTDVLQHGPVDVYVFRTRASRPSATRARSAAGGPAATSRRPSPTTS